MSEPHSYTGGTITVTNGSTAVTGSLTAWASSVLPGDEIVIGATRGIVETVNSNTSITLNAAWSGSTYTGAAYIIAYRSALRHDVTRLSLLYARWQREGVNFIPTTGQPDNSVGNDGWVAFDLDAMVFYQKIGDTWDGGTSFKGSVAATSDGSAAAPSISFLSDPNTGIYRIGADQLGFATAGLLRAAIDATGRLGINVAAPLSKLHINHEGSNGVIIENTGTGTTADKRRFRFDVSSAGTPRLNLQCLNDANAWQRDALVVTHDGNIGLNGVTSPAEALDLNTGKVRCGGIVNVGSVWCVGAAPDYTVGANIITNYGLSLAQGNFSNLGAHVSGYYGVALHTAGQQRLTVDSSGNIAIGNILGPSAQLHTSGTVRLANFGAGTAQFDASGNVSSSSDERLKDNIEPFSRGLADIAKLDPISFNWNAKSGLDRLNRYSGFSAQNVEAAIPEAIGENADGYLSLQERPILAALVNAIKELKAINDQLVTRIAALEGA